MTARSRTPAAPAANLAEALEDYAWASRLPLTILVFLGPLIVLYECGTWYLNSDFVHNTETRVLAFSLIRQFMRTFGLPSRWMPGLAVMFVLLVWHIARGDRWRPRAGTAMLMLVESALLAFPILLWSRVQGLLIPLYAPAAWKGGVVLAVGAGIYEEAVFRLFAFAILDLILIDLLRVSKRPAYLLIVVGSSMLFAMYHYWSPESSAFHWSDFIFRTISGIYFGLLFLYRGFGITAGCHAAYDVYYFLMPVVAFA